MGLVATSAASAAVVKLRLVPTAAPKRTPSPAYLARNVLPTGFFMAVTFFMGNTAYLYLTVAFVQVGLR